MTTIGIARRMVDAATRRRSIERRFGNWTVSVDLAPTNPTVEVWIDGPSAILVWLGPIGFGITRADPNDDQS